jgi:DNA-binding transcriptional MerR regulator
MALKMKELITLSGESKSTILYYLKEGLLPPPKKLKANLHLYDESCVDIIKFIKYLQANYHYSIAEIKEIFNHSNITKENSFYFMVQALELANSSANGKFYSQEEFLKKAHISQEELDEFLQKEYIYKHKNGFGEKELEIVALIKKLQELGLEELIKEYVKSAKAIATIESKLWERVFEKNDTIKEHQLSFDTTLKLKPYIYNMQTLQTYYKQKDSK